MLRFVICLLLPVLLAITPAQAEDKPLVVFAAASLKTALDEVSAAYGAGKVTVSYAASSALAKQIEEGAPADIFISADMDWMNTLGEASLVKAGSVVKLLGNELVLVAPADSAVTGTIEKGFDLAKALNGGKLAMADTKSVPAGKYGKAALISLGLWDSVSAHVVQAENVRAALKLVALKEAALGVVYASDAVAEPLVKVVGTFPADSHVPIIYPVGVVSASANAQAAAFMTFLQSPAADAIFAKDGFQVLTP